MSNSLFIFILLKILSIIVPLLISVAFFTILERKLMGIIQRRKGPNVIGFLGLMQPFADGLKLFVKETILPSNANIILFFVAPILTFCLSLVSWAIVPFSNEVVLIDLNLGVLYLLVISGLNVYGLVLAGWSSNSKYPFLGAIRSAAQLISYEISIGFIILTIALCCGSLNLSQIVFSQKYCWLNMPLLPIWVIFYVSILAETNRHPFDLPEAEAELVSGYNVEYSSMTFALFFLGEYSNMLLMSALGGLFFLGGWWPISSLSLLPGSFWFSFKVMLGVLFFIFTRAGLPRYRYDQLMNLGWKCFLPLTTVYFLFTLSALISFNNLPN